MLTLSSPWLIRSFSLLVLSGLLLAAVGCGGPTGPVSASWATTTPRTTVTTAIDAEEKIKVKAADERTVVELRLRDDEAKVEFDAGGQPRVLRGDRKESGKRKYSFEGGALLAEVKPDDRGFKVRTPEGRLLWKVTLDAERIRISPDEEHSHPFVLRARGDDRFEVLRETVEVGNVTFDPTRGKVTIKDDTGADRYDSNTTRFSAMYGIMLMPDIPDAERYIVMVELLALGR